MKRHILLTQLPFLTREFVIRYRIKKNRPSTPELCLCEAIEILLGTSAHHFDTSFEGGLTFDNLLDLREVKMGWDGSELLDILIYYLNLYIRERVAKSQ